VSARTYGLAHFDCFFGAEDKESTNRKNAPAVIIPPCSRR
jgi:hypothetical protein